MRSYGLLWLALALCSASNAGCVPLSVGAQRQFSRENMCPKERVTVVAQKGRPVSLDTPPDDIRSDPERLALWNRQQQKVLRAINDNTYFVVTGCGLSATYFCNHVSGESVPECMGLSPLVIVKPGLDAPWPDAI